MTSFFSAEGGPIGIKFWRLVQNDMSTAVIWLKSKPDLEFQYGGHLGELNGMSSQSPEPPATLQGAATWRIQCHDSKATCHIAGCCHLLNLLSRFQSHMPHRRVQSPGEINVMVVAGCKSSIRHIKNRFSPYFIIFVFF